MPRVTPTAFSPPREKGPEQPIAYAKASESFRAFQAVQDAVERRYWISARAYVHILVNRHNSDMLEPMLYVQGLDNSSLWPADMTPAEMVKCAEIKSMFDEWKAGRAESLPLSTVSIDRGALTVRHA